jgi:hypothetical protein
MKLVVTGLLFLLAAASFACNDSSSGAMSADEYFARLDQIFAEADDQSAAIADPFLTSEDATLDERKGAALQAFNRLDDLAGDVANDVGDLDPPADIERLHGLLVNAVLGYRDAIGAYAERIEGAESDDAFTAIAEDPGAFEDAIVALEDICIDMQDAAGEREIRIDLECGE